MTRQFIEATTSKMTDYGGERVLLDVAAVTAMREEGDHTAVYVGGQVFYVTEDISVLLSRLQTTEDHSRLGPL